MIIIDVPLSEIKPYKKNPRQNEKAIEQVRQSIEAYGFKQPIVVDKNDIIVVGHTRFYAALDLDLDVVPVLIADDLNDAECKAYRIADNKTSEFAEWDMDLLKIELNEIDDLFTGFSVEELNDLIPDEANSGLTDDDAVPDVPDEPIAKLGDIYQLGNHRLMCGDSTEIDHVEKLMNGEKADMVFADPPYGINVVNSTIGGSKSFGSEGKGNKIEVNKYSEIIGDDTIETASNFYKLCNELGFYNFILWGGNYFTGFLPPRKGWVVWDKKGRKWDDNFSDFEMAWSSYEVPAKIFTHVWMGMIQSGEREKRVHPTQKPTSLVIDCFEYFDKSSKLIFDGFLGSGSTLIACEKTNRSCFGMELDPHYIDVIIKRWQDFTGKDAIKVGSYNG